MRLRACIAAIVFASAANAADLRIKGDDFAAAFNIAAAKTNFPGTMILQNFTGEGTPSFRYALGSCIGILGYAKSRKAPIDELLVIASGCKDESASAPLVSFLAFTGALCTQRTKRSDGAASVLGGLKMMSDSKTKQTVLLETCTINMSRDDVIGFRMTVE